MSVRSRAPSDPHSDRALALAMAAASALTLSALFWPAAFRRVFVYTDLGNFFLPMRIFLAQSLEQGITPLWMPNLFCGFYAHGEGQIGIFHPLRWLLYRILPVTEAFNAECLVPYPFALAGVALFLRRLALPASAAIFGGASFAFSAYMTVRLTHVNAITVIAHLGWLLLTIDVLLRETGRRRGLAWVGIALVTGSQLLVGYPVGVAYCWMLAIPYAVFIAFSRRELWPALAGAAALTTGILLGAIQVVPTYDYLATSLRADPTYAFLTSMSLHPVNLLSIVSPWLFRNHLYVDESYDPLEQSLYLGAVVPIAVLWVGLRWRQLAGRRSLASGLLALSAIALLLALGEHTGLYPYFLEIPLIGLLRVPARYSVVIFFTGAVLAAIAFSDLQRGNHSAEMQRRGRWLWLLPAVSWLVAGIALVMRDPIAATLPITQQLDSPAKQLNAPHWIVLGPILFTIATALFTAVVRGQRSALFALALLALVDHATYAARQWWVEPPRTLDQYRENIVLTPARPPYRAATSRNWGSFYTRDGRGHHWASTRFIVRGARLVSGYAGLMPAKQLDYQQAASLRVAGAAAFLNYNHFEPLRGALPRARLVTRAVRSADPRAQIESVDVATTALVDEPIELAGGPAGEVTIEEELPGTVRVATRAETRQLLVLAESFHPGWRVSVDGDERRVIRVYGDFIGSVVEPGAYEIWFQFAPLSFEVGRWASLAAIGIVLVVALASAHSERHRLDSV